MRHIMKARVLTDPPLVHTITFNLLKAHCTCGWESNGGYDSAASHKRAIKFLETLGQQRPL